MEVLAGAVGLGGDLAERSELTQEVHDDRRAEDHVDGLVQDEEEARVAGEALVAGDDAVDRPGAGADREGADRHREPVAEAAIAAGAAGRAT